MPGKDLLRCHVLFENLAFVGAGLSDLLKSNIPRDESLIDDGCEWNLTHPGVEGVLEFTQAKYCLGANGWGPDLSSLRWCTEQNWNSKDIILSFETIG